MALSATVLAAAIKAKLLADASSQARDVPALDALCKAVAEACVEHITSAGVVTTTFAPGAIAVTGTAAAQANPAPVAGTGGIT